jgi:hypothetical protein
MEMIIAQFDILFQFEVTEKGSEIHEDRQSTDRYLKSGPP